METKWLEVINIAENLQHQEALKQLYFLQQLDNQKELQVPIIGQFSAGKSNTLNNLLGQKILPTMSVETTAFVTKIKYGAEQSASIYTKSGKVYEISIDSLLLLSQRKIDQANDVGSLLGIPDITKNPIMLLEVYYPSPLLQNGLVIVDTPGLNTLMQDHKRTYGTYFAGSFSCYLYFRKSFITIRFIYY